MTRFIFTTDVHYGYERRNGHKIPLHDQRAFDAVLKFAQDFKPHTWVMGGDILDCGSISHHNKHKPRNTEGMRLLADAEECRDRIIKPAEELAPERVFIEGNHCDWINDFLDEYPALEGILDVRKLLQLDKWKYIPQGGHHDLGKLTFIHGDTISGGEHVAKAAVINYERSIRFGHFHTFQTYSKTSAIDYKNAKTGVAVPCLCTKSPKYGEGRPNRWQQGFLYGYVEDNGMFWDNVVVILDGRFVVGGKTYRG